MELIIENGGWEVRTTGEMEGSTIEFVVRRPVWERIGYKCKVDAELVRKGGAVEINLVHKKILPFFITEAIRKMTCEVLRENGISLEPVLRLVSSNPKQKQHFRRRA